MLCQNLAAYAVFLSNLHTCEGITRRITDLCAGIPSRCQHAISCSRSTTSTRTALCLCSASFLSWTAPDREKDHKLSGRMEFSDCVPDVGMNTRAAVNVRVSEGLRCGAIISSSCIGSCRRRTLTLLDTVLGQPHSELCLWAPFYLGNQ